MPTYDYECRACGHVFERTHSMTAEPVKKCPKCSKNKVTRLIGPGSGLIFKGTGFYATDYRKGSAPSSCPTAGSKSGCSGCPGSQN